MLVRRAAAARTARGGPALLYRVLDALSDSFFPAMDELDADIDGSRAR